MHDLRLTAGAGSATEARWDLDYFVRPSSFSEVEATRAELEGLAYRYRTEIRTRYLGTPTVAAPTKASRLHHPRPEKTALSEFRNAPGEAYIAQDLPILLKRSGTTAAGSTSIWICCTGGRPRTSFPSSPPRARTLALATGRQEEVETALRHA